MPLPPAPTKRAALLSPDAYEAPARGKTRAGRKTSAAFDDSETQTRPQAREPYEHGGGVTTEALAPAAPVQALRTQVARAAAKPAPTTNWAA